MTRLRSHCWGGRVKIQTLVCRTSKSVQPQSKSTCSWRVKIHLGIFPNCFSSKYLVYYKILTKVVKIIWDNSGFSIATELNFILTWNMPHLTFFSFFSLYISQNINRMCKGWPFGGGHLVVQISMYAKCSQVNCNCNARLEFNTVNSMKWQINCSSILYFKGFSKDWLDMSFIYNLIYINFMEKILLL